MTRRITLFGQWLPLLFACLALLFSGCGGESHDQIATEFFDVMDRVIEVCDQIDIPVTDEKKADASKNTGVSETAIAAITKSAEKIKPKLTSLLYELKGLESRLNSIEDVDDETKQKLSERFHSEFETLRPKFSSAMKKLEHPAVKKVLETEIKTLSSMFNAKPPR